MADKRSAVQIVGLLETKKALVSADATFGRGLQVLQKALATEIAGIVQERAASVGGVAAKSAQAVKGSASQTGSAITLSAAQFPFALGAEFGAKQYPQFQPWLGNQYEDPLGQDVGYFLHPTLRAQRDHIIDEYDHMIDESLAKIATIT